MGRVVRQWLCRCSWHSTRHWALSTITNQLSINTRNVKATQIESSSGPLPTHLPLLSRPLSLCRPLSRLTNTLASSYKPPQTTHKTVTAVPKAYGPTWRVLGTSVLQFSALDSGYCCTGYWVPHCYFRSVVFHYIACNFRFVKATRTARPSRLQRQRQRQHQLANFLQPAHPCLSFVLLPFHTPPPLSIPPARCYGC